MQSLTVTLCGFAWWRATMKTSQFCSRLRLASGVRQLACNREPTLPNDPQLRSVRMTNIFVGNLSYETSQEDLEAAFNEFGAVERVNIVRDRDTGQPRGFAFVEMTNRNEASSAIAALNGRNLHGRDLSVNEARPREERSGGRPGGGGGGRGGFKGGGGGGGRSKGPRW